MYLVVWLAACQVGSVLPTTPDDSDGTSNPTTPPDAPFGLTAGPSIGAPAPGVWLARWFELSTNEPTSLSLTIEGPEGTRDVTFPDLATSHRVPVLELRSDTTYTVTATVTNLSGEILEAAPVGLESGPLPLTVPTVDLTASTPDRMEPGLTLMVTNADLGWILGVDAEGFVVYAQEVPAGTLSVVQNPDGDLTMVDGFTVAVRSVMGDLVKRYTASPSAPEDVQVAFDDFHHEVLPQPDGSFFSLSYRHVTVPEYPTSYELPFTYAPATIRDDLVVHVAADGTTLAEFSMLDLVDVRRVGFDSLGLDPSGALDWVHANALQYDADTDEITVSLRHQDAVVRFYGDTGEVKWIFGPPFGWAPELEPLLLTQTAPFTWPTHQHAVEIAGDGLIRMFDNGNHGHDTPYYDVDQPESYSRIFEARLDEEARTVTKVREYREALGEVLYSGALGNADLMPLTTNRLGTWGTLPRIVEFATDGEVVFDMALVPGRYSVDRALRVASLYPADVTHD